MPLTLSLHRAVQAKPDALAIVFGERRLSFRQFTDRVARLAGGLRDLGMATDARVGILALNSDRYLETAMAVWWGGGVLNPVNTRWSVPEIVYSLDDCDTRILLVDDTFLPLAAGITVSARHAPVFVYLGDGPLPEGMIAYESLIADRPPAADAFRSGDDLACIMYTGGTTGFPKGVMQSHLNLWAAAMQRLAQMPVPPGGFSLQVAPLFHIAGLGRAVTQFVAGEAQAIVATFDPAEVLRLIEQEGITDTVLVPTMVQALLSHPDLSRRDLRRLQRLTYGASPSAAEMVEQVAARLPHVGLTHGYGLTEACPTVSLNPAENHTPEARRQGLSRSVGRAAPGLCVRIVGPQGEELPRGSVGEIILRGPNVMRGYWNKPEETAQALRNGWLHTGDGGYMDEAGYIYIVDRLKDMIVSGGENVYSAEVENVILRHPGVAQCAVIGVPHPQWGEAVHAVVVPKPGAQVSADELRAYCRGHIAGYKCPKTVAFAGSLPLSGAGKVLKRELRAQYTAPGAGVGPGSG